jgi:uncharacterized protein YbaP (TraB family)
MRRGRRLAVLGAVLLALAGCGEPRVQARPPLWKVSDGDTTIWLLGSIHQLPANVDWRTPAIDRAIGEADTLILESSPEDPVNFRAMAEGPHPVPLEQRVSPGKLQILDAMVARSGVPRETLANYKDWALAVTLDGGEAKANGASPNHGVERKLWDTFGQAGKTRSAFYRAKDQLLLLDGLSPDLQREMLGNTISVKENYSTALAAWEKGDLAALTQAATCTPLDGKLVGEPNAQWARWIAWRMKTKGNLLIAVGLGHFAGPYDLTKMLAARGLKVERVQ